MRFVERVFVGDLKWGFSMEHSSKLEVKKELREDLPFDCLPEKFLWMKVNHGSKMRNLLGFAADAWKDERVMIWTAKGPAVNKAISCAEIMKRKYKNLHQITRVCFFKDEESCKPTLKGEDTASVLKQIPAIYIMLSKDPLDSNKPGYQGPESLSSSIFKEKPPQDAKEGVSVKKRKSKMSVQGRKSPVKSSNKQAKLSTSPETDQGSSSDSKKRKLNPKKKKKTIE